MRPKYFSLVKGLKVVRRSLTFFLVLLGMQWARAIPGFSYGPLLKNSCRQSVGIDKKNTIETLRKHLPGTSWPEGLKDHFSLMEFNLLNLIDHADAAKSQDGAKQIASGHGPFAKPLTQLEGIARVFKAHRPAIAFCVEISSVKTLRDYDQQFLGDQYEEFSIEGNDPRGIDVGLLVRKDLPLDIEVHSHKNLIEDSSGELVFSRDLPFFILSEKGASAPFLIIVGTHFKSQRSTTSDAFGQNKRTLQATAASLIISEYQQKFPGVPIVLTGDFNNDVRHAPEFSALRGLGFKDAFDLAKDTVPLADRGTHFYFPSKGAASVKQLDAILLDPVAARLLTVKSAKILPHLDPQGNPYPAPKSYAERETRASDHLPILTIIDF